MDDPALCRELVRAATANGVAALSLPGGTLDPGAPADFVAVDDPGDGEGDFFTELVERTGRSNVRLTVVGGHVAHGDAA
jgi:cytosine/adenosine deaminase-related metal-dependent hydrolase